MRVAGPEGPVCLYRDEADGFDTLGFVFTVAPATDSKDMIAHLASCNAAVNRNEERRFEIDNFAILSLARSAHLTTVASLVTYEVLLDLLPPRLDSALEFSPQYKSGLMVVLVERSQERGERRDIGCGKMNIGDFGRAVAQLADTREL